MTIVSGAIEVQRRQQMGERLVFGIFDKCWERECGA
jgi:hypothetical protein